MLETVNQSGPTRTATGDHPEPIDFLIVTILDIEFEAVRRHIPGLVADARRDEPIVYLRGQLPYGQGSADESYAVVLLQLNGMGNPGAAVGVTTALQRFEPQATIIVGIAGGVPGELAHGDVAVSRDLVYYEYGKQHEGHLEHRAPSVRAHPVLANHAKHFAESDWHARIQIARPGAAAESLPQVKVGTIGSGEKVVNSASFISELKTSYKHLIAVAMEGTGAASPAQYLGAKAGDVLEVRGISDLADGTKDDRWQEYAADVAAAFMTSFLATGTISSRSARQAATVQHQSTIAIRLQSMAPVNANDAATWLRSIGANEVHDSLVDLVPFAGNGGRLRDAAAAVAALTSPDGAFSRALATGGSRQLTFYGHAHIPLVILAGALATDRLAVQLIDFQRNAVPAYWGWPTGHVVASTVETALHDDPDGATSDAVLRISLSYKVAIEQTARIVAHPRYAYDISLATPALDVVRSEAQARKYAAEARRALDALARCEPRPSRIHVFYAGPVSAAFAIGQGISPTIHPTVVAWNYRNGAYDWGIDITRALDGDRAVATPDNFRSEGG